MEIPTLTSAGSLPSTASLTASPSAAVVSAFSAAAVVSAGLLLEQAVTENAIAVARPSAATFFSFIIFVLP